MNLLNRLLVEAWIKSFCASLSVCYCLEHLVQLDKYVCLDTKNKNSNFFRLEIRMCHVSQFDGLKVRVE